MMHQGILANAIRAYPNAATETEALCLVISRIDYHRSESLDALKLNAEQAQIIARLSLKLADQAKELDTLRKAAGK